MARKPLSTKIENDLQKEIKKLAIDLERPLNDLLEEAIQDILKKCQRKAQQLQQRKKSYQKITPIKGFNNDYRAD